MIGLCGSHRTGKTTLAKAYAEQEKIALVETNSSGVYAKLCLDPQMDYDFKTRMEIQNEILSAAEAVYAEQIGKKFITDRTPIDFLAYTLADVLRTNLSEQDAELYMAYHQRCIDSTNRNFGVIVIVQPGIPLVDDPTKGPINKAYMEHINTLVMGLSVDARIEAARFYISRSNLTLKSRLKSLNYSMQRAVNNIMIDRQESDLSIH